MTKKYLKKIAYTDPETNTVAVVFPAAKEDLQRVLGPLTDEEYEDHVWERSIPDGAIDPVYIEDTDFPDTYFRDAWKQNPSSKKIEIDMKTAREIHMNKIRVERDKALQKLDVETMKGNDVQSEKQILRDIPNNFDLTGAKTPEKLKNLWPKELK
jgi:hypothetical protein